MSQKTSLPLSDYALGFIYLVLILALVYLVTVLDAPDYTLGAMVFVVSVLFAALGNLTNRLILAKLLPPLAIILSLMFSSPVYLEKFKDSFSHEMYVVRMVAAVMLSMIISVATFRINIAFYGSFIERDKPIPPPVSTTKTLLSLVLLPALTVVAFYGTGEPGYKFIVFAASNVVFLLVLYDAAFTHILHTEAKRRIGDESNTAADLDQKPGEQ